MKNITEIERFLKLISEISKNGISIDSNLVYSNLISIYNKKESTIEYFDLWQKNFEKVGNMSVFVDLNWKHFCQFKSYGNKEFHDKIKVYIPMDREHIYYGVNQLFEFIAKNNISHLSKVSDITRFDDVVLRLGDANSVSKIIDFINKNSYIKEGLISPNPFSPSHDGIAVTWDGSLSYNYAVSEWISDYINVLKINNKLEEVSYVGFYSFIKEKYERVFLKGININEFSNSREHVRNIESLLDYKFVTEILLSTLTTQFDLFKLCSKVEYIKDENNHILELNKLRRLVLENRCECEITPEQREIFDYAYFEISKKNSEEYAFDVFKAFSKTGNYRLFTRTNNVRNLIISSGISPSMMKQLIYEEQKNALINASLETIKKYDSIQLAKAISSMRVNNYNSFTNENNVRRNLQIMVKPEEIDALIESIIKEEGGFVYNLDDSFWIFIELIKERSKSKSK